MDDKSALLWPVSDRATRPNPLWPLSDRATRSALLWPVCDRATHSTEGLHHLS